MGDALSVASPSRPLARLVADARPEAGLGHLARCTALACALREQGFELETVGLGASRAIELDDVTWEPEGKAAGQSADVLVLDTYDRSDWNGIAATPHGRLVAFDDALLGSAQADVVIAGLRSACLRRDFWELPARQIRERTSRVLVTTGGGDIDGLAVRLARGIAERCPAAEVELIWGPGFSGEPPPGVEPIERPPTLREPLLRADVVVCTGGQTMLEAAATGAPIVALEGAANQAIQLAALEGAGAIVRVTEEGAPAAVAAALADAELRRRLSDSAREAVDGRGALRIAAELAAPERR